MTLGPKWSIQIPQSNKCIVTAINMNTRNICFGKTASFAGYSFFFTRFALKPCNCIFQYNDNNLSKHSLNPSLCYPCWLYIYILWELQFPQWCPAKHNYIHVITLQYVQTHRKTQRKADIFKKICHRNKYFCDVIQVKTQKNEIVKELLILIFDYLYYIFISSHCKYVLGT